MHITLDLAPFRFLIDTNSKQLLPELAALYPADRVLVGLDDNFYDFTLSYRSAWLPGSPYNFRCGKHHFRQSESHHLISTFEWGLNWTLSSFQNYYLCIHAAVLEKNNKAVIMPAPPGSGKSTLCALLMLSGWRLLSDEHCLVDISSGQLIPAVRPVAIKNRSFAVIRQWAGAEALKCIQHNTLKGTVGYLSASPLSWQQAQTPATPAYIVMPTYCAEETATEFTLLHRCDMLLELVKNSFNYQVLGQTGFDVLTKLVEQSSCYRLRYHDTLQAMALFDELANA